MESTPPDALREVLANPADYRLVDDGIGSVLRADAGPQVYDSFAAAYDRVVGNRIYQRLAWGNDIAGDAAFAAEAVANGSGWLLDAGCGSLLFTDAVHRGSSRPTLLFDLSLEMLRRARGRVLDSTGRVPNHLHFLQGDVLDLPFVPGAFETVLCPGILHLFSDHRQLLTGLVGALAEGGGLFVSALVTDRSFGARIQRLMQRRGEIPEPIDSEQLAKRVERALGRRVSVRTNGNMAQVRSEPTNQPGSVPT